MSRKDKFCHVCGKGLIEEIKNGERYYSIKTGKLKVQLIKWVMCPEHITRLFGSLFNAHYIEDFSSWDGGKTWKEIYHYDGM